MAQPKVRVQVMPGSQFSTKVLCTLQFKDVPHEVETVSHSQLKKKVPPPHLVPVLYYNEETVVDSRKILPFIDERHHMSDRPLYPEVQQGRGGADEFESVKAVEEWAHDMLSSISVYVNFVTNEGKRNVTIPMIRSELPRFLRPVLFFVPPIIARSLSGQIKDSVSEQLGKDVVESDQKVKDLLIDSLRRLERCFKTDDQQYIFDTATPTAADFSVFAPLLGVLYPTPDLGFNASYPTALKDAAPVPRLEKFMGRMKKNFYDGKVVYEPL